ncbi:hypothetical protein PHMEG_00019804 [Phytophthora megakarya]|uniref:Uncharacterized protein n=1 Tax=Phytophthora megakarya TaxID=4795 RepID=A0A225VR30_9STRA|nr:hypothetical protein PHMEG_00019804 [Phytophthora megakarya]
MIVSFKQFRKGLKKHLVLSRRTNSLEILREILRVLHELGDILWYEGEKNNEFDEWIILDPNIMLHLVRDVINHKHQEATDKRYEELRRNGILRHSLLMTFPSWDSLGKVDQDDGMVHLFKRLLHHLNLVYPVNDVDAIDEADIIVPLYWKTLDWETEETADNTVGAPAPEKLTRQNTILAQKCNATWYIAKWMYSLPIVLSDVLFVNFVVKCYHPSVRCDDRDTHFEVSFSGKFCAAIYHRRSKMEHYEDLIIEVAAPTMEDAWEEMKYFVMSMETVLEKDYQGLIQHSRLNRAIVDENGKSHDVDPLMEKGEDLVRLRQRSPWIPPKFSWFIQRAWKTPGVLENYRLADQTNSLIRTDENRTLPSRWKLLYPEKGSPVELRILSDISRKCWHESKPLIIPITDNLLTRYPAPFQVRLPSCKFVVWTASSNRLRCKVRY